MESKTRKNETTLEQKKTSNEWQKRAQEAAKQFNITMPTDEAIGSPEEVEQRLRWSEQEGGE